MNSERVNAKYLIILMGGLLMPSWCNAHSYVIFVSTPITPPTDFLWWLPFSVVILLISLLWLLRKTMCFSWKKSFLVSFATFIVFSVTFFVFGVFVSGMTTAPIPGLGMPCPVFWGFGRSAARGTFIFWNVVGIVFLLFWLFIFTKTWRTQKKWKLFCFVILIYVVCLLPYLFSGAFVHGWTGGYVYNGCARRIDILTEALFRYAESHDRKWPEAGSFGELMEKLSPYISEERFPYKQFPLEICPVGGAYERDPKPYIWNSDFSGKSMFDFSCEDMIIDHYPIMCGYHKNFPPDVFDKLLTYLESRDSATDDRSELVIPDAVMRINKE